MSGRSKSWGKVLLSVAGLLALLVFAYSPVLGGSLLAGRDVFRVFFPDSAFLLESLRAGEMPLWNPYLRLGQPFAATLYSQVYYPPRWVAVLLAGPIASMTVMHIAHAALAAVGVFLLARRLRASWPAALVAGAMFGLSPMMTDLGIQQNVVDAAAWSGFIVLAALDLAARFGRGPLVLLAVTSALSLFAGSPETTLWQGIVAVLVALFGRTSSALAHGAATGSARGGVAGLAPSEGTLLAASPESTAAVAVPQGAGTLALSTTEGALEAVAASTPRKARPLAIRARALAVVRVAAGFVLSIVLASVVLLPAAEFAGNSLRAQRGWSEQLAWSVSWPQVLSTVWPLADWPRDRYWGEDQWFILNLFLGTLPCALAVMGGLHGPRRVRPFVVGALGLVMLSLGRHLPPAAWFIQTFPPFSLFRYPAKYFVGAAFCFAVLSAFGLDAMGRLARSVPPSRWKAALAFIGMGVAIAVSGPLVRKLPMRASAEAGAPWVPFALGLAVLVFWLLPWSFARPRRVRHGLAALAILELAAAHSLLGIPKYTPWEALRQPFSLRPHLPAPFPGRISADIEGPEDPTRAVVTNTIERSLDRLMPNRFVEERLPALEGYGAPEPLRSNVFHLAGERGVYDLAGVTHYLRQGPPPFEDLELLNQAEDGTTLSRSRTALPHAFLVQRARVVTDEEALDAVLDPDQPFREIAFLSSGEPLNRPACKGTVSPQRQSAQHLSLEVNACDESYLVVSDSHYPGWRATVDGKDVPIHRANLALRAVRLSPGEHHIRFDYQPTSFRLGLVLSLLGGLTLVGLMFLPRLRPKARPG
ncbi:YfhO family protein [Myxococcus landrumensis]|uniref:YfhO family protein n=1 Tax=Myxococcus landrumensis TaxID=2813577 RepID=A0ABX7N6A7_9BACT|nr:YfhO family protein [Myxococcus landrumus]QSQ14276.1 YfhO family protein [Myxococcus landrumus]